MKLQDKVCIVTGSASGIGLAIARRYISAGARVVIADLNQAAAEATAAAINAEMPGRALAVAMDVTDEDAVNAGIAAVVAAWGGIDDNTGPKNVPRAISSEMWSTARKVPSRVRNCFVRSRMTIFASGAGVAAVDGGAEVVRDCMVSCDRGQRFAAAAL